MLTRKELHYLADIGVRKNFSNTIRTNQKSREKNNPDPL